MHRRALVHGMAAGLLAAPWGAHGQASARSYRIGVLGIDRSNEQYPEWKLFVDELARRGYVEGHNLAFEHRYAGSQVQRIGSLAAELVAMKVDLIYTVHGTICATAAKAATSTIPIVFWATTDPVRYGLVASLARPGGNLTGTSALGFETESKTLELLVETVGKVPAIALVQPSRVQALPHFAESSAALMATARALGTRLQYVSVDDVDALEPAIELLARQRVGAVIFGEDEMFWKHRPRIAALFTRHRLPTICDEPELVRAGLLLSYAVDGLDLSRKAADKVDRIFKGARPADLPIEQVSRWHLVVNLKTAKAIGVKIPATVFARANEVIE